MNEHHLTVVGIGHDGPAGLSAEAHGHIEGAETLAGGRRQLDFFSEWQGEKIVVNGDVAAFVAAIETRYRQHKTIVLASGDPLFYGIGKALLEAIPKEDLLFVPHVGSIQLAFARVKESWQDAHVVSVHGRPMKALVPAIEAREAKIAVLTDTTNHPAAIADLIRRLGAAQDYALWVCENLGGPDERVSRFSPAEIREDAFSPLNVVVLLRQPRNAEIASGNISLLGIPESAILHQAGPHGMITRREVRLMALCYLELQAENVLWDIGAGSGSVSLEAARLGSGLQVFAIEREAEAFRRLEANVANLGAGRVRGVRADAPDGLSDLPDPDAVFIGGSGGRLTDILQKVAQRLRPGGRIVLNCITLENLSRGWEELRAMGLEPEATSIQLAHSRPLGRLHSMAPDNPIFILRARKP
jgi:precorrin-6B C5,15-methyltransferase / cobalt-precorrin-6B C5,C15-methyltransferase